MGRASRSPAWFCRRIFHQGVTNRGAIMATIKELHVNGSRRAVDADAERSLLSVLRDDLDLTGSKYGCGEGSCGACTVLIDGSPTRSCTTRAGNAEGKQLRTVEGL